MCVHPHDPSLPCAPLLFGVFSPFYSGPSQVPLASSNIVYATDVPPVSWVNTPVAQWHLQHCGRFMLSTLLPFPGSIPVLLVTAHSLSSRAECQLGPLSVLFHPCCPKATTLTQISHPTRPAFTITLGPPRGQDPQASDLHRAITLRAYSWYLGHRTIAPPYNSVANQAYLDGNYTVLPAACAADCIFWAN